MLRALPPVSLMILKNNLLLWPGFLLRWLSVHSASRHNSLKSRSHAKKTEARDKGCGSVAYLLWSPEASGPMCEEQREASVSCEAANLLQETNGLVASLRLDFPRYKIIMGYLTILAGVLCQALCSCTGIKLT